jgi:hypothetical protein
MYSVKAFHIGGQFIEISGPCGMKKRFAKGTKASFAVERFNCLLKDPNMPVVCIAAVKEGEEPIEFGNDVELILYDNAWTLQIVQEGVCFPSDFWAENKGFQCTVISCGLMNRILPLYQP